MAGTTLISRLTVTVTAQNIEIEMTWNRFIYCRVVVYNDDDFRKWLFIYDKEFSTYSKYFTASIRSLFLISGILSSCVLDSVVSQVRDGPNNKYSKHPTRSPLERNAKLYRQCLIFSAKCTIIVCTQSIFVLLQIYSFSTWRQKTKYLQTENGRRQNAKSI